MARYPRPYQAQEDGLDEQDPTLNPDKANANDNGSSTPPAPKPYRPAVNNAPAAEETAQRVSTPMPTTQAPTFSQMQAQGEARPPMPTHSGDFTPPTASAPSAPLIAAAAGGTMTPQGDAGNAFRGYESSDGGTFGQADTGDRSQALRALESISGIDSGSTYQNGVYGGGDPTKFGLGAGATSADVTALSKLNGLVANGDPAGIQQALSSGNPWLVANAQRELAKHPELSGPGATGRIAGNYTAKDPAEQAAGLAAQGLPPVAPSGNGDPQTGGPSYGNTESAVTVSGRQPVHNAPGSGGDTSPAVPVSAPATAQPNNGGDILKMLMGGANAPGKYGTDQVKKSYDWLGGQIDDQFNVDKSKLGEEMARRGLGASTIYGGRLNDLNIGKRTAKESMAYDLADKVAGTGALDQSSRLDYIKNLMGYGQQGFENDMSTAKFNADENNNWQDFLMKMLGQGYGTAGG